MAVNGKTLDVPALESWLWEAACTIRGPLDAPKFKDYILPLIFLKRLSDVFDIARLLDPQPSLTVYDACCWSGGLLIKCHLQLLETKGKQQNGGRKLLLNVAPLKVFGQEINPSTFAMSRMNTFIRDMEAEIALGDSLHRPAFTESDGYLRSFDLVTSNPMWNQKFDTKTYADDPLTEEVEEVAA